MGALSKHKRGNNGSASNQPSTTGQLHTVPAARAKPSASRTRRLGGVQVPPPRSYPGSSTQRPKPQVCVECGETVLDLAAHLQSRHGHVCPCCKKRFGNRIAWHNHLRDVHNVTGKALAKTKIDEWLEKTATSSSPSEVFVDSTSFKPRTNSLNDFATKNPKLAALGGPQPGGKKKASTRTLRRARSVSFGAPDQHLLGRFACLACDDQPGEQNSDAPLFAGRSLNADSQVFTSATPVFGVWDEHREVPACSFGGQPTSAWPQAASSSSKAAVANTAALTANSALKMFTMADTDFFREQKSSAGQQGSAGSFSQRSNALPLSQSTQFRSQYQADPDDRDPSRANFPEEMGTYSNPYPRIPRVTPEDLVGDDDDL